MFLCVIESLFLAFEYFDEFALVVFPYQFRFNSKDDTEYKVQASEDLKQWIQIYNIKGNGKTISYSDKRKAIFSKQFYRVVLYK